MEPKASGKKKKGKGLENFTDDSGLIIKEPKRTNKNELYSFSCEVLSIENIVLPTKRNLNTLVVIGQSGITSLNGISELNYLRELWIVECSLEDFSDLQECKKLETLYLYSNNISQVPNMSKNPELKLLSLSGNNISHLKNFHSMPNLQELYIANNKIKKIGNSFFQNFNLTLINFAGNLLYDLKDFQNLLFTPSLRSIIFADPLYGECPIVSLSHYRHFVINYLERLTELDYYPISDEERSCVTGFFKNKMLVYDMLRNKNLNDFTNSFKDGLKKKNQRLTEHRKEIYFKKLEQLRIARGEDVGEKSGELLLRQILQRIYRHIDSNENSHKKWIENSRINLQILQQKLSLKAQHFGNVDFVEYLPIDGNSLIRICQDICNDSLCQTIRNDLGITGVHIHRVTKVTNNETDAFRSSTFYRENVNQEQKGSEYVFKFLVRPVGVVDLEKWPFDIFEEEFFDATEIITSDCLAAADADLMKRIYSEQRSSATSSPSFSEHRLAILVQLPVSVPTMKVERPDDYHAMHEEIDENTCGCFSIMKPEQVKPVFVVEYEYVFQKRAEEESNSAEEFCTKVSSTCASNVWTVLTLENLGNHLHLAEFDVQKLRTIDLSGQGICAIDITTSLPNLRELYLSCNKLTALPNSAFLKYVKKLDVSFNDIRSFGITACLPSLESFDAAWNLVDEFVAIMPTLKILTPNLAALNLKHNPFTDVTEMESMFQLARNAMPLLKFFNKNKIENFIYSKPNHQNPWTIDIFEKSDATKLRMARNSIESVISEMNKSLTSPFPIFENESKNVRYVNLSHNYLDRMEFAERFPRMEETYLDDNLLVKIFVGKPLTRLTKVSLNGNLITILDGLTQENFPVLNYLDLSNNLITSLIGIGTFHTMRQFYCSHNRIGKLEEIHNLKNWHGLKVVDLSNNPIDSMNLCNKFFIFHVSKIEFVGGECVTASDISEANRIFGGSLDKDTISKMCSLRDFENLKQLSIVDCAIKKVDLTSDLLPNLKSFDLSKNEISTLWGLHDLKNLQVLCLSHNQVKTAVPNYRKDLALTECSFPGLKSLFLDHNGIRSLVDLNFQNMPVLNHLYLQHNKLHDANGLQKCANLETLVLDYNKIQIITEEDFHTENNIKSLLLENNMIKFLSFAKRLSKITKLFISNNKLADKDQLKYLSKLEHLKEITILGNPLCKKTNHFKFALQVLVTLNRIDGHSVILNEYFDTS